MATVTGPLIVKTNNSFMGKTFVNGTTSVRFSDKTSNFFKLHSHKHSGVQSFRLANRKTITSQAGCKDSSLLIATTKTNSFHNSLMKKEFPRMVKAAATKASPGKKEEKWSHEGLITESLPNGMFRVQLDNEDTIIGYVSGKIRRSFIRILPGDRVKVEITRYDSTRGRIIYRLRNNESKV